MGNGKEIQAHRHHCCDCGERWTCTNNCLARCHCLGKPYCMHWHCVRCRERAEVDYYTQPVRVVEAVVP